MKIWLEVVNKSTAFPPHLFLILSELFLLPPTFCHSIHPHPHKKTTPFQKAPVHQNFGAAGSLALV